MSVQPHHNKTIVLVNNNKIQREAMKDYIKRSIHKGYDFLEYDDCLSAQADLKKITAAGQPKIAAIITADGAEQLFLNGVDFIREIRKTDKDLPVYFTSSSYVLGQDAHKAGATGFLHNLPSGIKLSDIDGALVHISNHNGVLFDKSAGKNAKKSGPAI